eukprot:Tamp_20796.p1 GENE.Tamp_20796~~Tamp_20796.p1  ORF type:complete len:266 (+),score=40.76 Tamp_20796:34-798(+)
MGNVTSLCGSCNGTGSDVDRSMLDAKLAEMNLDPPKWQATESSNRSGPHLSMPKGPGIINAGDGRSRGIMKGSPRGLDVLLADHHQSKTRAILENDDEMDTEAYQAMLDNMTIDDTTMHMGPLTEDDDGFGLQTEDDLTFVGDATERDMSESIALKSSRSNKNVSWRDNISNTRIVNTPDKHQHRSVVGTKDSVSPSGRNVSMADGTDTRYADSEAQNSQLRSRSDDVRKRSALPLHPTPYTLQPTPYSLHPTP